MKGCVQCLRIILIVLNFLVVLVGLVVLGFAVYVYMERESQALLQATGFYRASQAILYVLMGVGGLTLVIALFGCCGAYHESQCLLATYISFLLIIFALQVTSATLGYVYKEDLVKYVDTRLLEGVGEYSILRNQRTNSVVFMDPLQRMLMCCGANNYEDYKDRIPIACCDRRKSNCDDVILRPNEVYQQGCKETYKSLLSRSLVVLFVVTISFAVFEILCLIFALIMCCYVRQYHVDYYGVDYHTHT